MTMAKPSLTSQFDAIQARLEAAGLEVTRRGPHEVIASVMFDRSHNGYSDWTGSISIEKRRDRPAVDARVGVNHISKWVSDPSPTAAFAALLAKPFGRTTIGAVFGITPDEP